MTRPAAPLLWLGVLLAACKFDVSGGQFVDDRDPGSDGARPADDAGVDPRDAGTDAGGPDAQSCEGLCGAEGECIGGACVYDCSSDADCPDEIVCPSGVPCQVDCIGASSCAGGVDCTAATACQITCAGAAACANEIECGPGACAVTCSGPTSCANGTTCSTACSCEVDCSGSGACADDAACPNGIDCEDGAAGCTLSPVECQTCS